MVFRYLGTAAAEGIPAYFCGCDNCKKARLIGGRAVRSRPQAIVDGRLLIDIRTGDVRKYINDRKV